eukprot:12054263-Alexandrium_andersonii.AAC.1
MSASLVGSEMCIRDRCSSERVLIPRARAPSTPEARALRSAEGSCSSEACLLYTSDAADDM